MKWTLALLFCLAVIPINTDAKEWVGYDFGMEGLQLLGVGFPSSYSETEWTDPITGKQFIDIHIKCDPCDQVCAIHDADGTLRTNGEVGAGCGGATRSVTPKSEDVFVVGEKIK